MIYQSTTNKLVSQAHTVDEFVNLGEQSKDHIGYADLSYIEKRNNLDFVVKSLLDDYSYEINQMAKDIELTDKVVIKYRYNPKLLSYDLYNTTRLYYVILRINNICNVHEFSLENHTIKLLEVADMTSLMSGIYRAENLSLQTFANAHANDVIETPINKYVYKRDPIARFNK